MPSALIVGCGGEKDHGWSGQGYTVTTLDIEPRSEPDIVASMVDMGEIGQFDAVYCCHALEHLYPHEVTLALREFYRVLTPGGKAVILVPDLEGVEANEEPLTVSYGKISGLHMFYGDSGQIEQFPYMAHHCGFVSKTLRRSLEMAGFSAIIERCNDYNLLGIGVKDAK